MSCGRGSGTRSESLSCIGWRDDGPLLDKVRFDNDCVRIGGENVVAMVPGFGLVELRRSRREPPDATSRCEASCIVDANAQKQGFRSERDSGTRDTEVGEEG